MGGGGGGDPGDSGGGGEDTEDGGQDRDQGGGGQGGGGWGGDDEPSDSSVSEAMEQHYSDEGFLAEPEPFSPLHHLSEQGRRLWAGVLNPRQMSDAEIQDITKLTRQQFDILCEETAEASRYPGTGAPRILGHVTRVLILFLRWVKTLSFTFIGNQCRTTRPVVTLAFHDILFFLLLRHSSVPCFWNDQNLSASKLNDIMQTFNDAASPGLRDFLSKFRNARGLPVGFAVTDTTAVPITKSADPGMSQVTYAGVPGSGKGQSASLGIIVATEGTIIGVQAGPLISGGVRSGRYFVNDLVHLHTFSTIYNLKIGSSQTVLLLSLSLV